MSKRTLVNKIGALAVGTCLTFGGCNSPYKKSLQVSPSRIGQTQEEISFSSSMPPEDIKYVEIEDKKNKKTLRVKPEYIGDTGIGLEVHTYKVNVGREMEDYTLKIKLH